MGIVLILNQTLFGRGDSTPFGDDRCENTIQNSLRVGFDPGTPRTVSGCVDHSAVGGDISRDRDFNVFQMHNAGSVILMNIILHVNRITDDLRTLQ